MVHPEIPRIRTVAFQSNKSTLRWPASLRCKNRTWQVEKKVKLPAIRVETWIRRERGKIRWSRARERQRNQMKNAKCYNVWAQCGKRRSDKSEENNRTTIIGYRESKRARYRVECKLLLSCGRSPINHVPCFKVASWDTGQAEIWYMLVGFLALYSHCDHT